jgi:hypothetical protein
MFPNERTRSIGLPLEQIGVQTKDEGHGCNIQMGD